MATTPPDILITTPESLYLLLTSAARTILRNVDMVIIDEIHSLTPTKRGAHLALSLERLDAYAGHRAQRIGLSATARSLDEVGKYLTGGLPYTLVQPPAHKEWDLDIVVPIEDMSLPGQPTGNPTGAASGNEERHSIWPHIENRLLDLITTHRSTLIFVNSRRVAERLTARINEEWDARNTPNETTADTPANETSTTSPPEPPILARAHHGSVSSEQRTHIEESLKSGQLPAVIATSSLELGIDMGEIDLVAHIDAPPSVASGLQRVGRAGHHVGARSHGIFLPTHRSDLIRTTVVCERMRAGLIETLHIPTNPLDVLAQHIVAMCAMDDWSLSELTNLIKRTASYATIPTALLTSVLDMLAGRYPDENFAGLRPRIIWDRSTDTLTGRPGSQRIAVTSGGTIPDRGQFGVFLIGEGPGRRVGELEEEMVYESRVGDVFTLGTSSWRIEEITHDQVLVTPAPGIPGRLPFWRGDTEGREAELGAAIGAFMHEIATLPHDTAINRATTAGLDTWAATNLVTYIHEQKTATGAVPSQNTIILEIFPDELGDTQIVIHSPWGSRVNAPWSLAIAARLRQRFGIDPHPMHADDGIILRLPETTPTDDNTPTSHQLLTEIAELITIDPDEITDIITNEVGGSALFASRFRECASRALLLPRRNPAARQALWQQRRRSAQLLEVASRYQEFPIVLETLRECMQDVFDVPALKTLMTNLTNRRTRIHAINTPTPSPMARTLLFGYIAQFLYEGDSPLAERRAAALSVDPELLADILGTHTTSMRELLDPTIVEHTEAQLQALDPERSPRNIEETFDLIRRIGPLTTTEITTRAHPHTNATTTTTWIHELHNRRRIMPITMAGEQRWALVEDAGR
ncbi:DEAD/DEAH box helicase, partial [Dermatophilus congolensis]|nr:DEAD/DEAH box helicase [Dermatophilus congolensis]MBO3151615.1 DEAD/DEAH box helicase [Dermatophilus congolensis]